MESHVDPGVGAAEFAADGAELVLLVAVHALAEVSAPQQRLHVLAAEALQFLAAPGPGHLDVLDVPFSGEQTLQEGSYAREEVGDAVAVEAEQAEAQQSIDEDQGSVAAVEGLEVVLQLAHVQSEAHVAQQEGGQQLPVVAAEVVADGAHHCQAQPRPERQKVGDVLGGTECCWIDGGLQKHLFLFLLEEFSVDAAVSNVHDYHFALAAEVEVFAAAARQEALSEDA